jgi:hypothetical protein
LTTVVANSKDRYFNFCLVLLLRKQSLLTNYFFLKEEPVA